MTLPTIPEARSLAQDLLEDALPRRWSHVQAVGTKAERICELLDSPDGQVLSVAAWLHDVGYSPDLVSTGFHSLDGARWLRTQGIDDRVAALVAHHSCAWLEAMERGLDSELHEEFPREESVTTDALCYCDMTTGPDGQDFDASYRLTEIRSRYGPDHLVTRFITRAEPEILAAVRRTEGRLSSLHPR
ncbi:HD domain-containing protein [Micromonospora sp. NPDC051296]|uniref:HD domain-containing protein n=1 Tax=Micromonospora sp. NPDC051296 TaxID=3155046 RepID=UPI00341D261C